MQVTIYTIPTCQFSAAAKNFLTTHNIPFIEKDVETNMENRSEMLAISENFAGVPFTLYTKDDGSQVKLKGYTESEFADAFVSTSSTVSVDAMAPDTSGASPTIPMMPTPPMPAAPTPPAPQDQPVPMMPPVQMAADLTNPSDMTMQTAPTMPIDVPQAPSDTLSTPQVPEPPVGMDVSVPPAPMPGGIDSLVTPPQQLPTSQMDTNPLWNAAPAADQTVPPSDTPPMPDLTPPVVPPAVPPVPSGTAPITPPPAVPAMPTPVISDATPAAVGPSDTPKLPDFPGK